jgi:hypothetical protein
VNVVRSDKSDGRFFMVAPGLEFPVGGAPANPATSLITPDPTLDVANYLTRGTYQRNITPRFFWNADPVEHPSQLSRRELHRSAGALLSAGAVHEP